MYPAYRLDQVLRMPGVTFFAMLNEGYRLAHGEALLAAQISDLPHISKEQRSEFYRNLRWASQYPGDILKIDGGGSSPAEIKKALGG